MSHSNLRTLIERGRKAGLSTTELYAALNSRPPEGTDGRPGEADGNGYISEINEHGQRVYRPTQNETR